MDIKVRQWFYITIPTPLYKKRGWSGNEDFIEVLLEAGLPQVPPWHGSLRRTGFISAIVATISFLIRGLIINIIILHTLECFFSVGGGGSWGRNPYSRRWCTIGVGGDLLTHILFFIRVTEDDELVIARCPQNVAVEVAEELPGELHIPQSIRDETLLIRRWRKIHDWSLPRGIPHTQTPVSVGDARRPPVGIPVVAVIQKVPAVA
jgi:hypothetical protein